MSDLIDRLKAAWTMLNDDGDEYGLCDTLHEAAAALEAAREDAERYRWLRDGLQSNCSDAYEIAEYGYRGGLDAAIDQARGKGVQP